MGILVASTTHANGQKPPVEPLSDDELSSGEWVDEKTASDLSGLTYRALESRRKRGSLESRPRRLAKNGGRDYYYLRSGLIGFQRATVAPSPPLTTPTPHPDTDIELIMARASVKEFELQALQVQLDAANQALGSANEEIARLRRALAALVAPSDTARHQAD